MRYTCTLLVTLFWTVMSVFSATISGTVTDASTGKPLEFASVFITGTTYGTNAKKDGTFNLTYTPSGTTQIVIAHLGYQTFTKNIGELSPNTPLTIQLQLKSQQLSAVSVIGYDTNRKKNMAEFLFGFMGDSECGKKCTILNPNVLHLERKEIPGKIGQNQLIVYADSDLIIENKQLGYIIRYTLEQFSTSKFQTTFKGYPLFIDNLTSFRNQDKIIENRERAYQGSQMHFFRCLFTKTLQEDGFKIYEIKKQKGSEILASNHGLMSDSMFIPEPNQYMEQTEEPLNLYENLYIVEKMAALQYDKPFEVRFTLNGEDRAYGKHSLYFNGMSRTMGQQATIAIMKDHSVVFYPNGSCKNVGSLMTIGYWSFKKMGETLPWNYQPPKTAKHIVTLH